MRFDTFEIRSDNYFISLELVDFNNLGFEEIKKKKDIQEAHGFILVYDITESETYLSLNEWIHRMQVANLRKIKHILILGNKLDVVNENADKRQVPSQIVKDFAYSNGAIFNEVSIKQNVNLNQALDEFFKKIYQRDKRKKMHKHGKRRSRKQSL